MITNSCTAQIEDVVVTIPLSRVVKTANITVSYGSCLYDDAAKVARWNVGKLSRDKTPQLNGVIILQPNTIPEESPPIQVDWKVPMASVSGLAVASLQLTNERYRPYKGVRALTKSGKYQIRVS